MGCGPSKKQHFVPNEIEGQDASVIEVLHMLELTDHEIDLLYTAFLDIDADGSGSIRPIEIFSYLKINLGPFERHIFSVFDEDKSGLINFMEFACVIWNFLTLQDCDLGTLMYLMKEPSGKLRIRNNDVKVVLECVHKKKLETSPTMKTLYNALKRDYSGELSISDIVNWVRTNPSIMSPVIVLQLKFRKAIIGEGFWLEQMAHRRQHPEFSKLLFIKNLQKEVALKNDAFKREKYKKQEEENNKEKSGGRLFQAVAKLNSSQKVVRKNSTTETTPSSSSPSSPSPPTSPTPNLKSKSSSKRLDKESSSQNLLDEVDGTAVKTKPSKIERKPSKTGVKIAGAPVDADGALG